MPDFVDAAIENLHREAVTLLGKPRKGLDTSDPHAVSLEHVLLHGIQQDGVRCTASPCRLGAVCFALYELIQYRLEFASPCVQAMVAAGDACERLCNTASKQSLQLEETMGALMRSSAERHLEETRYSGTRLHDHELTCERPLELVRLTEALLKTLEQFANDVRAPLQSPQLSQSLAEKGSDLLLTAVYQHLAWGKISYAQAAELVPDGLAGSTAAGRVRHRVKKAPDARSIVPADVLQCVPVEIEPRVSCT
jgi:hypothetical protein